MFGFLKKKKPTNQVKFLREKKGMTQKELARSVEEISKAKMGKMVPLSWQTVRSVEEYRYIPSLGLAQLLAEALGEDLETVFFKLN